MAQPLLQGKWQAPNGIRASVPRGTLPPAHRAWSLDRVASGLGTDRKTLLLLGLAGLVGGYLLNDGIKAARRTLKRSAKRTRHFAAGVATPRNLIVLTTAGLGLGAAYWYFRKHQATLPARAALPPKPRLQLPTRPA